jgi:hypothetical protein
MKSLPGVDVHKPDVRVPINGAAYDQALDNIATRGGQAPKSSPRGRVWNGTGLRTHPGFGALVRSLSSLTPGGEQSRSDGRSRQRPVRVVR